MPNYTIAELQEQGLLDPQNMPGVVPEQPQPGRVVTPNIHGIPVRRKTAPGGTQDPNAPVTMGSAFESAAKDTAQAAAWGTDFVVGGIQAIAGGAHALSSLAYEALHPTKKMDLGNAVKQIENWTKYMPSDLAVMLGVPEEWVKGWVTEELDKIPHAISTKSDDIGEWVRENSDSVGLATGTRTTLEVGTYALAFGLAGKASGRMKQRSEKKQAEQKERDLYNESMAAQEAAVDAAIGRPPKSEFVGPHPKPPLRGPVQPAQPAKMGPSLPEPQVMRRGRDMEFKKDPQFTGVRPNKRGEVYDPTVPWDYTDFQKARIEKVETVDPQMHLPETAFPLDFPVRPKLPEVAAEAPKRRGRKKKQPTVLTLKEQGRQQILDFDRDTTFERGQALGDHPGFLRSAEDLLASKYFEKQMRGIESRTSRGRQSGAIDINAIKEGIQKLMAKHRKTDNYIQNSPHLQSILEKMFHSFDMNRQSPFGRANETTSRGMAELRRESKYFPDDVKAELIKESRYEDVTPGDAIIIFIHDLFKKQHQEREGRIEAKIGTADFFAKQQALAAIDKARISSKRPGGKERGATDFGFSEAVGNFIKDSLKGWKNPKMIPPVSPRKMWEATNYDKLTPEQRLVVPDVRPLENLLAEIEIDVTPTKGEKGFIDRNPKSSFFGKQVKDIKKFGKNMLTEYHMAQMYAHNPFIKWGIDNLNAIAIKWDRLGESIREHEVFSEGGFGLTAMKYLKRKEAGPIGFVDNLQPSSKQKVYDTRVFFDDAKILHEQGLMWPTEKMLQERGLNAAEIRGYQGLAKMTDSLYDVVNYARGLLGKKNIRRIPGYFPHLYEGNWTFQVVVPKQRPATKTTPARVEWVPVFFTRTTSKMAATKLKSKLENMAKTNPEIAKLLTDAEFRPPERMKAADDVTSMNAAFEEALRVYDEGHWATPVLQKVFHTLKGNVSEGVLTHALNRSGVKGSIANDFGLQKVDTAKLKEGQERYVRAVMEYAKRAEIITKVEKPLSDYKKRLVEDMKLPETVDYIESSIALYKGDAKNHFQAFDNGVEMVFDGIVSALTLGKQGFSGQSVRNGNMWIRNYFATKALGFYRLSYLGGNVLQPHYVGLGTMTTEAARLGKGDPYTSMALLELNTADVGWLKKLDPETKELLDWGIRNKVLTPSLFENVDFGIGTAKLSTAEKTKRIVTGRGAAEYIEKMGRMKAFVASYKFYRSADFGKTAARDAAVGMTDRIMFNYNKTARPHIYTDFGIIGETMSPFAVFAHSMMSNTVLAAKAIAHNKGAANKVKPLVANMSTQLFFGGIKGIVGVAEVGLILSGINKLLEWAGADYRVPSLNAWLLEQEYGDLLTFGAASAATTAVTEHGANVGSLFRAPAADDFLSAAGMEWWIGDVLGKATPALFRLFGEGGTEADVAEVFHVMAPNATAGMQDMYWARNNPENVAGEKTIGDINNRLAGRYPSSKAERITRAVTGSRSLKHERYNMAFQEFKDREMSASGKRRTAVEQGAYHIMRGEKVPNELYTRALNEGILPQQFHKKMLEEVKRHKYGALERKTQGKTKTLMQMQKQKTLRELNH